MQMKMRIMRMLAAICLLSYVNLVCRAANLNNTVNIGLILDSESWVGKVAKTAIKLAVEDVNNHSQLLNGTRLVVHLRDAQSVLQGVSTAVNLLEREVVAIVGPQTSEVAEIVARFGDAAKVPILSFSATSPLLSNHIFPYFVRMTHSDGLQMKAIAALVSHYGWRRAVFIHPDDYFGLAAATSLSDALRDVGSEIEYRSAISPTTIKEKVRELMTMESRVFVVHMRSDLSLNLFKEAQKMGMMGAGYVWITSDWSACHWDIVINASTKASMQGLLGVKTHIFPNSNDLTNFSMRWKHQFNLDNPNFRDAELNLYGVLAYDTVLVIAQAIANLGISASNFSFVKPSNSSPLIGNAGIKVSQQGKLLLQEILGTHYRGLSGQIQLRDGEMDGSAASYEIVNVVGKSYHVVGYWTNKPSKLCRALPTVDGNNGELGPVIWPGKTVQVPRGWEIPPTKRLKIGVPTNAWRQFVAVTFDAAQNKTMVTGFCKDIFDAVQKQLGYQIPYDIVAYRNITANTYDNLLRQVYLKRFDGVLGDTTILARRIKIVDFTQPFTTSGFVMVVPTKSEHGKDAWTFLMPFTTGMWGTTFAFVVFTGVAVWLLEHRVNPAFRGSPHTEVVTLIWFALSSVFNAHREKIESSLARIVIVVWLFVALVLTSSYTASLSSRLTVEQIKPTIASVEAVIASGVPIGYQNNSFIRDYLHGKLGMDLKHMKAYHSLEEYAEALSKGPSKGGVAAIFDELPYIRVFLSGRCGYTMVGPTYKSGGFGFAFTKGSPLVPDISTAILNLSESQRFQEIEDKYFKTPSNCSDSGDGDSSRLGVDSFWGLFLITGTVSSLALIIFFARLLYNFMNESKAAAHDKNSMGKSIKSFINYIDEKEKSSAVSMLYLTENPCYGWEESSHGVTVSDDVGNHADGNVSPPIPSSVSIRETADDDVPPSNEI